MNDCCEKHDGESESDTERGLEGEDDRGEEGCRHGADGLELPCGIVAHVAAHLPEGGGVVGLLESPAGR